MQSTHSNWNLSFEGRPEPNPTSLEPQEEHKETNPPQSRETLNQGAASHLWRTETTSAASCTFVLLEIQCILFVCDNLLHVDHAAVDELPQDFDLADGRDGESFLLIVQAHLLQSHQLTCRPQRVTACSPAPQGSWEQLQAGKMPTKGQPCSF